MAQYMSRIIVVKFDFHFLLRPTAQLQSLKCTRQVLEKISIQHDGKTFLNSSER